MVLLSFEAVKASWLNLKRSYASKPQGNILQEIIDTGLSKMNIYHERATEVPAYSYAARELDSHPVLGGISIYNHLVLNPSKGLHKLKKAVSANVAEQMTGAFLDKVFSTCPCTSLFSNADLFIQLADISFESGMAQPLQPPANPRSNLDGHRHAAQILGLDDDSDDAEGVDNPQGPFATAREEGKHFLSLCSRGKCDDVMAFFAVSIINVLSTYTASNAIYLSGLNARIQMCSNLQWTSFPFRAPLSLWSVFSPMQRRQ